ncbi:MAG: trypsin-like peptidase domain-containing protein [Clostridia bacterium]|nr:trypsin-like peptidase domain-containing protein [Clostridia bacterium]
MLLNDKCKVCGGTLISIGNNTYKCKFCKNTYQETKVEAPMPEFSPVQKKSNSGANVFDKNINGILELACIYPDGACAGSGLLIDNSYAITNTHVVCDGGRICKDVKVRICDKVVGAKVLVLGDDDGGDGDGIDLALLKLDDIPRNATPLTFADFNTVRNGEQVYVIGNSLGDGTCITSGIVSDKSRILNGQRMLMTDCAINGGNSGGPIFNVNGDVIGVIVSSRVQSDGSATEGMNYAIPVDRVEEFICGANQFLSRKKVMRGQPAGRVASCPKCATSTKIGDGEECVCPTCRHRWQHSNVILREARKALAPCPRCGSWNTTVENNIFYCADCDFEG